MTKYNQALKEVEKYLTPAVGFSSHDSPKEDSKILIRQNNTILQLLVQILEKLRGVQSNKEIVLASSKILASPRNINSEKWTYLKIEDTKPSN